MNPISIPRALKRRLRAAHRKFVFSRALKRFLSNPEKVLASDQQTLVDLIYGWGNSGWSASQDYLLETIRRAGDSNGAVVECGSGLTTIVAGAYASSKGIPYIALEHHDNWGRKVQGVLNEFGIRGVSLIVRPLRDHGDYCWYNLQSDEKPDQVGLVICDGPPGDTLGGRYGFLPSLENSFRAGTVILIDDISRKPEQELAETVKARLNVKVQSHDPGSSFAALVVSDD